MYYRYTTGKIERIRRAEEDGSFVNQPQNLNHENAFGGELTTTYRPFKWWKWTNDINLYRSIIDGRNITADLEADTYSLRIKGSSKFTIKKKTDVQIRYLYRAPKRTTQGTRLAIYMINLAASRDIFGDKGSLTLSVRDLFNSNRYRYTYEGDNFYTESRQQWQSRNVRLTVNYRLGKK